MRRLIVVLCAMALALPAAAAGSVKFAAIDRSDYPTLRVTILTSQPTSREPLLRENGVPVQGVDAENLGRCANLVLGIDRSQSMRGAALADASAAARRFTAEKPGCTRIEIVAFGSSATELTGLSSATIDADYALKTIEVDGKQGTALWDAVALASKSLGAQASGGKVLILLTDGADTSSENDADEAVAAARAAGVSVFPIGIESDQFDPAALQHLAGATGGTYHGASGTSSLVSVYAEIQRELERTWRLSFPTAARPGDTPKLDASVPGQGAAQKAIFLPPSLGTSLAPEHPDPIVPAGAYEHGIGTLTLMLVVALATLLVAALLMSAPKSKRLRRRLEPHVDGASAKRQKTAKPRFGATRAMMQSTEKAFDRFSFFAKMQGLLERADMPLRAIELFYICVGCAFVPSLLFAFGGAPTMMLLAAMAGGFAAPIVFVGFKAKRRLRAIDDSLPDLLITLAASLKAGHSFRQGISAAAEEDQGPLTKELKRVLTETSLGRPMDAALQEMSERVGSKDLAFVITAVTIQRQVGGSLAGIFDLVADTIRNRQQFARKIRGLTAMGRASMWVLIALPFALAGVLTLMNRDYMQPLWHSHTGHVLIYITLFNMFLGWYSLRRIVNFKG